MAIYMWRDVQIDYLCFTANTANSTVALNKNGSPTAVTLEISTDGSTRTTYTFGSTITLSNIWDKVYWRNTSETTTTLNTSSSNYYTFALYWSINASGDVTSLINKNLTDTINGTYTFFKLFNAATFQDTSVLKTAPKLPATTLTNYCYSQMFYQCTWLTTLPELPATTLKSRCYEYMFRYCTQIKLSASQTWIYQTAYRIPITWTWTTATNALNNMFEGTWWPFWNTPAINTTYYTSNTVI